MIVDSVDWTIDVTTYDRKQALEVSRAVQIRIPGEDNKAAGPTLDRAQKDKS